LKCWQRHDYSAIPGCTGRGKKAWDYCYDPAKKAQIDAMAKDHKSLKSYGWTPLGSILGKCVGDCDHNGHCKGSFQCMQRNSYEKVPGCPGSGSRGVDYCYDPKDKLREEMARDHPQLKNYGWTPIGATLGKCVGDCDHNAHCRGGLKCWHRNANEKVPGCGGPSTAVLDYCYDPKDLAANHKTLTNYGWTPAGAPMGKCVGDCDHDGHCTGNLVCQQRNRNENVRGCSGKANYGVDYCVEPTKRPTKYPTSYPTNFPTSYPTNKPTNAPTDRCDADNCMNWTCADWCECYDDSKTDLYKKHKECQDDGEDTCICFEGESNERLGERHRKINYNQDAVNEGTAEMIEGSNVHKATLDHHYN